MLAERPKVREGTEVVALVSTNVELHQRLRAAFKEKKGPEFYAIEGTISEVKSHLPAAAGPSLLIADLNANRDLSIAAIESLRRDGFPGVIVVISDNLDEAAVRGLLRFRVSDWLRSDDPVEAIISACEEALKAHAAPEKVSEHTCQTFIPAAGGVGTTTLAILAGFLAAHRNRTFEKTCLIDLNFQSGSLADYLDLKAGFDVDAVSAAPERLDARLLEVMVSRHETGLAVLAPRRAPAIFRQLDEALIAHVLHVASETFTNIIVDMPPAWQPWSDFIVGGSDGVFVVTEFTVPALRKARELTDAIRPRLASGTEARVIVNKHREKLFGGGLKKRDASEVLGDCLGGFVPEDDGLVRDAINRGQPLSVGRPSNRISRELAKIVLSPAAKT